MINIKDPREFHKECVEKIFNMICQGRRRLSVLFPTGAGKTKLVAMLIEKVCPTYQKAVILTDIRCIKEQCKSYIEAMKINNAICETTEEFLVNGKEYELVVLFDVSSAARVKLNKYFEGDTRTIIVSIGMSILQEEKGVDSYSVSGISIEVATPRKYDMLNRLILYGQEMAVLQPLVYETKELIDVRDIFDAGKEEKEKLVNQITSDREHLEREVDGLDNSLNETTDKERVQALEHELSLMKRKISYCYQLVASVGIPQSCVDESFDKIEKLRIELEPYFYDESGEIVESVIAQFETSVSESIVDLIKRFITPINKEKFEDILKQQLSENVWNKLSDNSKSFLITAKYNYESMMKSEDKDKMDFSGVCLLLTKVLDMEIARRLYEQYGEYLERNFSKDAWPKSMLNDDRTELLESKDFTLGTVMYVIGCDANGSIKNTYVYNKFKEFALEELYNSNLTVQEIEEQIKNIVKCVEKVRIDYRNPSAHRNSLNAISAEACMGYMIDTYKKLREILENMRC